MSQQKTNEQVCAAGIAALRLALQGSSIHYDDAQHAVVRGGASIMVWFDRECAGPAYHRVPTDRFALRVDGVRNQRGQSIVSQRSFKVEAVDRGDKVVAHLQHQDLRRVRRQRRAGHQR